MGFWAGVMAEKRVHPSEGRGQRAERAVSQEACVPYQESARSATHEYKCLERLERREPRGMKEISFIKKRESRKGMVRSQTGGMVEKRVRPTEIQLWDLCRLELNRKRRLSRSNNL